MRGKAAIKCIEIETVAEAAAIAVADYFSDPDNVKPPTSRQLAKLGYSFDYPVEVKEIDNDMTIIITDDRNACSSGERFLYSFNGGSYWAN